MSPKLKCHQTGNIIKTKISPKLIGQETKYHQKLNVTQNEISPDQTFLTFSDYIGYYWTKKIAKNGPKQHNKLFLLPEGQKKPRPKAKALRRLMITFF